MNRALAAIGAAISLWASAASAAPSPGEACRSVTDPTARLACYDRAMGASPAVKASADPAPVETPPAEATARNTVPSAQARRETGTGKRNQEMLSTAGRIVAVSPIRHGYYRLELDDGTAYETTVTGAPPPAGATVQIRRTFLGTTLFDIRGWSPIAVRLARPQ